MRRRTLAVLPALTGPGDARSGLATAGAETDPKAGVTTLQRPDNVLNSFLEDQHTQVTELARQSDILEVLSFGAPRPRQFLATFHCKGLVKLRGGQVEEASRWCVEISLPDDYLRSADVYAVVALRAPTNIFHPNARFPLLCIGRITPATPVVDILHRCYDLITFQKYRLVDHFDEEAAAYVRANLDRFPLDQRPLKRRPLELQVAGDDEKG